jgi:hypothetical protein
MSPRLLVVPFAVLPSLASALPAAAAPQTVTPVAQTRAFVDAADGDPANADGLAAGVDRRAGTPLVLASRHNETLVALTHVVPGAVGSVGTRVVSTLDLPSSFPLPNGSTWMPCVIRVRSRRPRAWSSTPRTASRTSRRRTSASGASRCASTVSAHPN